MNGLYFIINHIINFIYIIKLIKLIVTLSYNIIQYNNKSYHYVIILCIINSVIFILYVMNNNPIQYCHMMLIYIINYIFIIYNIYYIYHTQKIITLYMINMGWIIVNEFA